MLKAPETPSIRVHGFHTQPNAPIQPIDDSILNRVEACIPILGIVVNHKTETYIGARIRCSSDTVTTISLIKLKNTYKVLAIVRMVIAITSLMQIGGRGWGTLLGIGLLLACLPSAFIHCRNIAFNNLTIKALETRSLTFPKTVF